MEPRRPGRPRSEAARRAILDATMEILREVGFDALAIEVVAARAEVGKTTIYRHWRSKEALVAEAIRDLVGAIPTPDTGSTRGDVVAVLTTHVALYRDPRTVPYLSALVRAMARSAEVAEAVLGSFHAARNAAVHAVLARGVARGELDADRVAVVADLLNAPLFYRALWTGGPVDERLVHEVAEIVLRGARPRSAP